MQLSIVSPVYNKAPYIGEMIKSILGQKHEIDWELILVDDGSTDSSAQVCRYYASQDHRISYYYKKHSGIADTRNYGNQKAKYDLISVCDADDIWLDNRFKVIDDYFSKNDVDMFYTAIYQGTTLGNPFELWKAQPITKEKLQQGEQGFVHGTSVYKRDKILKTPYRKEQVINDDFALAIDWLKARYKMGYSNEPTVIYRVLPSSISKKYFKKIRIQCKKLGKELYEYKKSVSLHQ